MALFDKRLENHTASAKIENMGQEERMNSLLKTMTRSLIIGGMVLMMSIGVNLWVTLANGARLEMLQAEEEQCRDVRDSVFLKTPELISSLSELRAENWLFCQADMRFG